MRKIKFRGKDYFGHWQYGSLITIKHDDHTELRITERYYSCPWSYLVYTNTVGQYIGVNDVNDKEIYEGDIVLIKGDERGVIIWDESMWKVLYEENVIVSVGDCYYGRDLEVIGNIHENKELLRAG